jgi:DNA polymerase-3 subunit alpha (Gram-positive type)
MEKIIVTMAFCMVASVMSAASLTNMVFVAFDTETTGLSASRERLVEIGAVKFRGREIIATTNWLINPGRRIPPSVIRVHGITDKMVKKSPPAKVVLKEFKDFIGDAPVLAHNARFDVGFVAAECQRNKIKCPTNSVIDSLPISRFYFPKAPAHNLVALTDYLHLKDTGHHRALADSLYVQGMMAQIFDSKNGPQTLDDLKKMSCISWPHVAVNQEQP